MKETHIYTDGSSRGNPGPSGWALVLFTEKEVVELGGRLEYGTNNQMELQAVVSALEYIETHSLFSLPIKIFIDSAYVQKGITLWMYSWEKNGWLTTTNESVLNQELWKQALYATFRLKNKVKITFEKVPGHANVFGNDRADMLATSFADNIPTPLFHGEIKKYLQLFSNTSKISKLPKENKKSSKKAYSYVSFVQNKIYKDLDWPSCEKRVKGVKGAKYKKVFSEAEEKQVVNDFTRIH